MDDFERIYLANLSSIALEDDLLENNNCFGLVFFPCNSLIAPPKAARSWVRRQSLQGVRKFNGVSLKLHLAQSQYTSLTLGAILSPVYLRLTFCNDGRAGALFLAALG